jgi:hypothetical protein
MLHFTTDQLLTMHGWCKEVALETGLAARKADEGKRYMDAAVVLEKRFHYHEIEAVIASELTSRGAHPLPRRLRGQSANTQLGGAGGKLPDEATPEAHMRQEWVFHCHPDSNYWECATIQKHGARHRVRSEATFETRADAIRDAKHHGLDPKDDKYVVLFRRYVS